MSNIFLQLVACRLLLAPPGKAAAPSCRVGRARQQARLVRKVHWLSPAAPSAFLKPGKYLYGILFDSFKLF